MRLGVFEVSLRIDELALPRKNLRQPVVNPKQWISPAERGRDPECYLEVVNLFLRLALIIPYFSGNTMNSAGYEKFTMVRKKTGCA